MRRAIQSPFVALFFLATIAQTALTDAAPKPKERIAAIHVRFADLDLSKEADARTLLGRLQRAAIPACGGNPKLHRSYELMPHRTVEVFEQCRQDAIARAVAQIDTPALSRLFAGGHAQPASCPDRVQKSLTRVMR